MNEKHIRTRYAPSPTGYLHVGSLRAALFEYAYAKTHNGNFILRIEDTDRKRYVEGAVEGQINALKIFGIEWDEGPIIGGKYEPYIQSERIKSGIYKKYADELVKKGKAYYCFCEAKDSEEIKKEHSAKKIEVRDKCRDLSKDEIEEKLSLGLKPAIRLKVPDEGEISYHDIILDKDVSWQLKDVDEAMLLKSDGFPTYHLGVVTDDILMKINPILRGFEWMPSTPIHLLIYKYLEVEPPQIGHFSLILDPDGGKLSKRKGNVACETFLEDGYLPEALLNFVMLLGWAPKDNREMFTLGEYVKEFKNGNLQIANAVFNREKLDWFNGQYIKDLSDKEFAKRVKKFAPKSVALKDLEKISPLVKSRMKKLTDFKTLGLPLFEDPGEPVAELMQKIDSDHLREAYKELEKIPSDKWNDKVDEVLMNIVEKNEFNTGEFFMSLRIAVFANNATPPFNDSVKFIGKEQTLIRLKRLLK